MNLQEILDERNKYNEFSGRDLNQLKKYINFHLEDDIEGFYLPKRNLDDPENYDPIKVYIINDNKLWIFRWGGSDNTYKVRTCKLENIIEISHVYNYSTPEFAVPEVMTYWKIEIEFKYPENVIELELNNNMRGIQREHLDDFYNSLIEKI